MSYWIEAGHVGEDAGKRREGQDRAIGLVEGERALSTVCWRAINFSSDLENRIDNVSSRMRDVFGVNRGSKIRIRRGFTQSLGDVVRERGQKYRERVVPVSVG